MAAQAVENIVVISSEQGDLDVSDSSDDDDEPTPQRPVYVPKSYAIDCRTPIARMLLPSPAKNSVATRLLLFLPPRCSSASSAIQFR